jgi:hypothetical protein
MKGNGFHSGKCSIGTSDDQSKDQCAVGGIYKGRGRKEEAPHYYLHEHAVNAAIKATEYFLLDEGKLLKCALVLFIKSKSSLKRIVVILQLQITLYRMNATHF